MRLFVLFCFLWLSFTHTPMAAAAQLSIEVAPVWWQYKEQSDFRPGIALSPLDSSASTVAMMSRVGVIQQIGNYWRVKASWEAIYPGNKPTERWSLASGNQTNALKVLQSEFMADLLRQVGPVRLGLWASYQKNEQSRSNFTLNGAPIAMGAVEEIVKVAWSGVAIESESADGRLFARFEAAIPVWVQTTNSTVVDIFSTRKGFRLGAALRWVMPWSIKRGKLSLETRYQFRQHGSDRKATALWPKNQWQSVSSGLRLDW